MTLDELNQAAAENAQRALLQCCGSQHWARRMTEERPFRDMQQLLQTADQLADQLSDEDWLEAFAAHPRIGERSESAWSQREQAVALSADEQVKRAYLG